MTIEDLAKKMTVFEDLPRKIEVLSKKINTLASKKDLEGFATKKDLERFATKEDLDELAIITKEGFDSVDFKLAIIDDRFQDVNKRMARVENKIDNVHEEVIKTNDAFARLKKYVDGETAAVISHLKRVDEKIGLA